MDGLVSYSENETPILRKDEYIFWKTIMVSHLKVLGCDVWNSVITDYLPPNRIRTPALMRAKKSNSKAMNAILDGLPNDFKEEIGKCNYARELWNKIKDLYSNKKLEEACQSEQSSICNNYSEDPFEEDSNCEAEVNLEAELVSALDDLRRYKQSCKKLKHLMLEKMIK